MRGCSTSRARGRQPGAPGSPWGLTGVSPRRTEAVEKAAMLRTRAMREKEEQREMRKYNYTLLRVRFPDGYILQGKRRSSPFLGAPEAAEGTCSGRDWVIGGAVSSWCDKPPQNHSGGTFLHELFPSPNPLPAQGWDFKPGLGREGRISRHH